MDQKQKNEINLEDVSKEELIKYLQEQKQNKERLEKKIKKLEERYLQVFKTNKTLINNLQLFNEIFNEDLLEEGIIIEKECFENPSIFKQKISEFKNSLDNNKKKIFEENKSQQKNENVNKEIEEKLQEISSLKHFLLTKDEVIKDLKDKIKTLENHSFNNLIEDLKGITNNQESEFENQIQESNKTNEIILLKQKIRDLTKKLNYYNNNKEIVELQDQGVQTEDDDFSISEENINFSKQKSPNPEENNNSDQIINEEESQRNYIRDLIKKYFHYQKTRNKQKRQVILNVLFDVLKFSYEEKTEIDKIAMSSNIFGFNQLQCHLSIMICVCYYYKDWKHPWKQVLTSFDQIKENYIRMNDYGQKQRYDNDLFYIKPIIVYLMELIQIQNFNIAYFLSFLMIFSKYLLLNSINLKKNEEFLFEILFLILPYFYYSVIIRDIIVLEFFLVCLFFYSLYRLNQINISFVIIGVLLYLNPAYILLTIITYKNIGKFKLQGLFFVLITFLLLISISVLIEGNLVKQKVIFKSNILSLWGMLWILNF